MNQLQFNMPTRQYFTWEEYRDAGLIVAGGISIINGGRNIGKTTGTFLAWLDECDENNLLFYIRNTLKEIESYRKTFNRDYGTRYYMTTTEIWKMEKVELLNKKTNQIEIQYRKEYVVGYVASLNGTDGWRSANFNNIKFVYSDEYNQIGNSLDVEKFLTLWTSILRTKQDIYTVIIGNRDDASAELIVEYGIDIIIPEGFVGDWIKRLLPDDEDYRDKCWFIDLDDRRFGNYHVKTVWSAMGRQSGKMGDYYDRGYKSYDNIDCRRLSHNSMAKVQWDWSYKYGDYQIIVGKLEDLVIAHLDVEQKYTAPVKYGTLLSSYLENNVTPLEKNYDTVFWYIVGASKEHNIVYTSIAVKEELNMMMSDLAIKIDEEYWKL